MDLAYLHIASLVFSLFFVLLLLSKKDKSLGDYLLVGFFGLLMINFATMFVVAKELSGYQFLLELSDASVFIYGPLLWWYVLSYTEVNFRFGPLYWGHGLPFLVVLALLEIHVANGVLVTDLIRHSLLFLKLLCVFLYLLLIFQNLARYQKNLKQFFSTTERLQLRWMYFLCLSFLGVWAIAAVSLSLFFFGGLNIPLHGGLYSNISVSLVVFVMGIYGFRQTMVFSPAYPFREVMATASPNDHLDPQEPQPKYRNSGLQASEAETQLERLLQYMQRERPYLDQDLTLFKLAEALDLPPNHLSQIINSLRQQNFFDFINQYRVEAVKSLLTEPKAKKMTLLGLGMEAGFKSKASFNRAFKKFTGQTPSEFKASLG